MLTISTKQALSVIGSTGLITRLLDQSLIEGRIKSEGNMDNWDNWGTSFISLPQAFISLPDVIVYRLLVSKDSTLHLGTVGLALWADKDIRPWYDVLAYYGMCPYKLITAMRYAGKLGIRRSLRSKPSIGYAYRRKAKQRVV